MKIKLDENLPFRLATLLQELGHDVHTVQDEHLIGHEDSEVWDAAQKDSRFLITQDLDFSDGILLVRLHSPHRRNLVSRVVELFQTENSGEWYRCFVVATERKIRVLRP